MMKALKEYDEMVMRSYWKWLEKHWKGYSVLLVIWFAGPYIWWYWDVIKSKFMVIKNKFMKNEEKP